MYFDKSGPECCGGTLEWGKEEPDQGLAKYGPMANLAYCLFSQPWSLE